MRVIDAIKDDLSDDTLLLCYYIDCFPGATRSGMWKNWFKKQKKYKPVLYQQGRGLAKLIKIGLIEAKGNKPNLKYYPTGDFSFSFLPETREEYNKLIEDALDRVMATRSKVKRRQILTRLCFKFSRKESFEASNFNAVDH